MSKRSNAPIDAECLASYALSSQDYSCRLRAWYGRPTYQGRLLSALRFSSAHTYITRRELGISSTRFVVGVVPYNRAYTLFFPSYAPRYQYIFVSLLSQHYPRLATSYVIRGGKVNLRSSHHGLLPNPRHRPRDRRTPHPILPFFGPTTLTPSSPPLALASASLKPSPSPTQAPSSSPTKTSSAPALPPRTASNTPRTPPTPPSRWKSTSRPLRA